MSLFKLFKLPLIALYPRHLANQEAGQLSLSRWRSSFFLALVYLLSLFQGIWRRSGRSGRSTLFWIDYSGHIPQNIYQCVNPHLEINIDDVAAITTCTYLHSPVMPGRNSSSNLGLAPTLSFMLRFNVHRYGQGRGAPPRSHL